MFPMAGLMTAAAAGLTVAGWQMLESADLRFKCDAIKGLLRMCVCPKC